MIFRLMICQSLVALLVFVTAEGMANDRDILYMDIENLEQAFYKLSQIDDEGERTIILRAIHFFIVSLPETEQQLARDKLNSILGENLAATDEGLEPHRKWVVQNPHQQ